MAQTGVVIAVNVGRSRAVAQVPGGRCAVFEWLSGMAPNLRDQIFGDLHAEGAARLRNEATGTGFEAKIHAADCGISLALTLAR
jgi:hypothetical protein